MNLQKTIAELEQQAAQYTEAANTLRALQSTGANAGEAVATNSPAATKPKQTASRGSNQATPKRAVAKKEQSGQKRFVSPETRAKIAAAAKARHAARKAAA